MTATSGVTPEVISSTCRYHLESDPAELVVLWVEVPVARATFEQDLRNLLREMPAAVVTVRQRGFDDPNSLLIDLVGVMNSEKSSILDDLSAFDHCQCFLLVLLAKTPLSVPQAASPITLPEWFPRHGDHLVSMVIQDVTWSASAALNSPEAKIEELCLRLYSLEEAIIRRFRVTAERVNLVETLSLLFPNHGGSSAELLAALEEEHSRTTTPSGFRPSTKLRYSVVGQLWRFTRRSSPEELNPASGSLSSSLDLPLTPPSPRIESFPSVLSRPTNRTKDWRIEFSRDLLHQVTAACQFTTAAAHSDAYAQYPIQLLIAYSYDLRRSLSETETLLNLLDS